MSQLDVTRVGNVMVLTLTRPDAGNRITQVMAEAMIAALTDARSDTTVSGCVLTGQGDVFCLGGDYQGAGPQTSSRMAFGRAHIDLINAMARFGKPLVAAVNGDAHAGGFSLVCACDLAFIAESATMGLPEVTNGLFPYLALAIVRNVLPKKLLFDIIYNARLLGAVEACTHCLANEALPHSIVLSRAIAAVENTRSIKPDVLMLGRDLYYATDGLDITGGLDIARFALGTALASRDASNGI